MRRLLPLGAGACLAVAAACGGHHERSTARSPFATADSLRLAHRMSEAAVRYRALRDSFAPLGDTTALWRAEVGLSDAAIRLDRPDSARRGLETSRRLAGSDPDRVGRTLVEWSIFYDRQGIFDSALDAATRGRVLAQTAHDSALEADADNALGRIHSLTGHYHAALTDNERALALKRAVWGDTSRAVAVELNELGIGYRHLGRFADARRSLEEALAMERAHRHGEGIARVSSNLANVFVATGDLDRALPLMQDALARAEALGLRRGAVYVANDLADLSARVGDRGAARRYVMRALRLNADGFLVYGRVQSLDVLARIELGDDQVARARVAVDSALALADARGYGRERVTGRVLRARVAIARGDPTAAMRWSDAAVRIADSLDDPDAEEEALEAQGAAREAAGRRAALDSYRRAIALLESWRGRLALGDLRMGVAQPRLGAYEGAIRMLVRAGRFADAFDVSEHARARVLLDLVAGHEAVAPRSATERVRQRLRERFDALGDAPPAERAAREQELRALADSLTELEHAEAMSPQGAERHPAPASLRAVQRGLLGVGRAMFAVFWGDRDVYGWWITAHAVRAARLGPADSLGSRVEFLRQALAQSDRSGPSWTEASARVSAALLAPLHPDHVRDLLVLADGPLAYLPVEVLSPMPGAPPLGTTTRITYGPSASVLLALAHPGEAAPSRALLAVGDPEPHGGLTAGVRVASLAPLPFAAAEAREVAALFPRGSDVLLERNATRARWLALRPGRYRYLHFAAHARVDDVHPDRTAILLADGALDVRAVRHLDLTADLVTLSACESALGRRVRGEGVIGLPFAFLAAGARGVVVTLWRVHDREAADVMHDFYAALRSGSSPADALLAVRRAHAARGDPAAEWAAFVLVGD